MDPKFEGQLSDDLESSNLLKKDVERIVGLVTPYLPFVGLTTGGVTVLRYAVQSRFSGAEEEDTHIPPSQGHDPQEQECGQK